MLFSPFLSNSYLTGFVEADGCFFISIENASRFETKYGLRLIPIFYLTQDLESQHVLFHIQEAFSCGSLIKRPQDNT
jgi:hypothetical protein